MELEYMGMVLAYSCLALEAQLFQAYCDGDLVAEDAGKFNIKELF